MSNVALSMIDDYSLGMPHDPKFPMKAPLLSYYSYWKGSRAAHRANEWAGSSNVIHKKTATIKPH